MLLQSRVPELMDDPQLDEQLHLAALQDLRKLNKLSGGVTLLFEPIKQLARRSDRPLRVLDIATGGGDTAFELEERSRADGLKVQIDGCDISARAIEFATAQAGARNSASKFFCLDAVSGEFPEGYDVFTCSLFTHHLDRDNVIRLMSNMSQSAAIAFYINDLVRSSLNLILVTAATRLVSKSPVVKFDGPASVRAAYTSSEMQNMAKAAGLSEVRIRESFPCRMLVEWNKNHG